MYTVDAALYCPHPVPYSGGLCLRAGGRCSFFEGGSVELPCACAVQDEGILPFLGITARDVQDGSLFPAVPA